MRRSLALWAWKSHGCAARNDVDCRKLCVCCSRLAAAEAISATLASRNAFSPLRWALDNRASATTPTATMATRTPNGTACSRKRRTVLLLCDGGRVGPPKGREPQLELCPAGCAARHVDGHAHLVGERLHHGEADADAPGANHGVAVAPEESTENPFALLSRHAGALVGDHQPGASVPLVDPDNHRGAGGGVLHRVGDEVGHDALDPEMVGHHYGFGREVGLQRVRAECGSQLVEDSAHPG